MTRHITCGASPLKSATPRELAFLDRVGLPKSATGGCCVFCGWEGHGLAHVEDAHHPIHRGRFGTANASRLPAFAAEGLGNNGRIDGLPGLVSCHALLHLNGGRLEVLEPRGAEWYAVADKDACKAINARRLLAGRHPITPGRAFVLGIEGGGEA